MLKQTPKKRVLFVRRYASVALAVFGVFSFALTNLRAPQMAYAASVNNTINFQTRLQTAAGAIVPDSTYNVEFNLYSVSSGGSSLWHEDYLNSGSTGLQTVNGYLSTSLGSQTAFPSTINWDQQLWIGMTVRGTGSCSFGSCTPADSEMTPRLQLTAVPYAFRANQLAQSDSGDTLTSTLSIQAPTTGNQTFVIQDQGASGTFNVLTAASGTDGYIKLQGASPSQQTGGFKLSGTGIAATLQAGTFDVASAGGLNIGTTNATSISIGSGSTTTLTITPASTINNTLVIAPSSGNTGAFVVKDGGGVGFLTVDTSAQRVTIGTVGACTGGSGKLCVNQVASSTAGITNASNFLTLTTTNGGTNYGQRILVNDTSSSKANTNYALYIDDTGTTNTSAVVNGIYLNNPSGLGGGNLIQLQTGSSDVWKITNAGAATLTGTLNVTSGYKFNGTSGVSPTACSGGQVLTNLTVQGGIITGAGTCATNGAGATTTLSDAYTNSGTTDPQIQLSNTNGGLKLRDASSSTITNLFQIQDSAGSSTYFKVTSSATTVGTLVGTTAVQAPLIQTADGATASTAITLRSGTTTGGSALSTGSVTIASGDGSGTNTSSGNVSIDSGAKTGTGTTGSITIAGTNAGTVNIANNAAAHTVAIATGAAVQGVTIGSTNSTSALTLQAGTGNFSLTGADATTYTIGSTTTTGTITIGKSTDNNTINIGTGTTATGKSQVVNIATSATGTGYASVSIGNTGGIGSLGLNSGTGGTLIQSKGAIIAESATDSTSAFQIQNHNASSNLLIADTTNTRIGIGMTSPAYTLDVAGDINVGSGSVYRVNGTSGQTITACTGGQVLTNIGVTGGIVTSLGGCATNGGGISPTLQNVYDNSGSTDPQVQLSNSSGGLKLRDASSSTIVNLFQIQDNAGSSTYFKVTASAATAGVFNAVTKYKINGTDGAGVTCSGGQFLQDQVVSGGITTGGTCVASGSGLSIGTIDTGSYSDNGAAISGTSLLLQTASTSHVGLVNYGTQSFAGAKTFTGTTLLKTTSATAFQVQDASANVFLTVDTNTSGGVITFGSGGTGGNTVIWTPSTGLNAYGTSQHSKTINLTAEYAGAVLDAAGDSSCSSANSGTMTSGFDATNYVNYYKWASTTTAQCYDVVVRVPVPTDFSSWGSSTPITINGYTTNTSTGTIKVEARDTGNTLETNCNYANVTPGSTSTWSTSNSSNCTIAGTYTAGGVMTLRIRMTGGTSSDVRISNIVLTYNSKF